MEKFSLEVRIIQYLNEMLGNTLGNMNIETVIKVTMEKWNVDRNTAVRCVRASGWSQYLEHRH